MKTISSIEARTSLNKPMKIKSLYLFHRPLLFNTQFHQDAYSTFLGSFKSPRVFTIRGSYTHSGEKIAVVSKPCSSRLKRTFLENSVLPARAYSVLEFSGQYTFPGTEKYFATDHTGKRTSHSEKELRSIWHQFLPDDLDVAVQSYILALTVAFPAIRPSSNIWFVDRKISRFSRSYVSPIPEVVEHLIENGISPKVFWDYERVVKWIFSQNGLFDGYSDTPASRAVNYFTRLFSPESREDEISNLAWALAGIEALLVESGRSSVGQLKEKLSAIFAKEDALPWIMKMVEQTYNYRSRMMHGDRQIRSAFRSHESEDNEKRFNEEYYSELFAIGILLPLLQFAIEKNISGFRFRTTMAT